MTLVHNRRHPKVRLPDQRDPCLPTCPLGHQGWTLFPDCGAGLLDVALWDGEGPVCWQGGPSGPRGEGTGHACASYTRAVRQCGDEAAGRWAVSKQ